MQYVIDMLLCAILVHQHLRLIKLEDALMKPSKPADPNVIVHQVTSQVQVGVQK
jgi:hypothetical protein